MIVLIVLLCIITIVNGFLSNNKMITRHINKNNIIRMMDDENKSVFTPIDDDDMTLFKSIATNYILNKFKNCRGDLCRELCDKGEVEELVRAILPPVSKEELEQEINFIVKDLIDKDGLIDSNQFLKKVMDNSYWASAGPLVVKELIFLDALYSYYRNKQTLLNDDDYNELKEMLTWEGSVVSTMKGDEALFVTAVAGNAKGLKLLNDDDYNKLKTTLQSQNSWVVSRKPDALAKLGVDTFMSYLKLAL